MQDYNPTTDEQYNRVSVAEILTNQKIKLQEESWTIERAIYDIAHDAYWLVTRRRQRGEPWIYRFAGPITLSRQLVDLLPQLTENERRVVQKYIPRHFTDAPYGMDVYTEQEGDDGA